MRTVITLCIVVLVSPAFAQSTPKPRKQPAAGKSEQSYTTCMANLQRSGIVGRAAANRCGNVSRQ
jgi:hypothetical protein